MAIQLLPGLFHFQDECNVYVLAGKDESIAIDFGSGGWLAEIESLKLPTLKHVFLTHHHVDQCHGLLAQQTRPFTIHAPAGEEKFIAPNHVKEFWRTRRAGPVPGSYSVLPAGLEGLHYDMHGFWDLPFNGGRLRFIHTPGHGPNAVSIIADIGSKQVAFCGDAACFGATIWQPYHLEWDHWTGGGALAAWEGLERLANIGMDLLCPSHGPVVSQRPRVMLKKLANKVLELYHVKGSICPGEKDRYLSPRIMSCGAAELLPGLIHIGGGNCFILLSENGQALAVDFQEGDLPYLEALQQEIGSRQITAALASHYHLDHTGGLPILAERYKTLSFLHPKVQEPIRHIGSIDVPWLSPQPIVGDALWPEEGQWRWNEFEFRIGHLPAQTWWHCCFMTSVAGKNVFFAGDNFQPNSRWNGTGGFCSFNGSRFAEGFEASARKIIDWKPDILACGHNTYFRFSASYFRKVIRWSRRAQRAVEALCPHGSLQQDYYLHKL